MCVLIPCADNPSVDEEEEILENGEEFEGADGDGPIVVVHPEWLTEALHTQLFLQLQDVLGQLPADLDSLKGFICNFPRRSIGLVFYFLSNCFRNQNLSAKMDAGQNGRAYYATWFLWARACSISSESQIPWKMQIFLETRCNTRCNIVIGFIV